MQSQTNKKQAFAASLKQRTSATQNKIGLFFNRPTTELSIKICSQFHVSGPSAL